MSYKTENTNYIAMKIQGRSLIYLFVLLATGVFISCSDENGVGANDPVVYAYFEAENQSIAAGESIKFKNLSIGHPSKLEWSFEGGTPATSTEQNPTVTYYTFGEYDVTLTVSTDADSFKRTEEDYVFVISGEYLSEHIVASYPFDGSAEDEGSNNIDATNMGGVTFDGTDRDGNENSAAVFSGSNALIVPDHSAFDFGMDDFSIGVWIKTDETQKMMIWQEGGGGAGKPNAWLRINDNTSDRLVRFTTQDSDGGNFLYYGDGPDSGVSDGNWHYLVCTREGGTISLYIDGAKHSESVKSTTQNVTSDLEFKIGTQQGPSGHHTYFTGMLDDLIIYDKALTDQEVGNLYKL